MADCEMCVSKEKKLNSRVIVLELCHAIRSVP